MRIIGYIARAALTANLLAVCVGGAVARPSEQQAIAGAAAGSTVSSMISGLGSFSVPHLQASSRTIIGSSIASPSRMPSQSPQWGVLMTGAVGQLDNFLFSYCNTILNYSGCYSYPYAYGVRKEGFKYSLTD